MPKIFTDFNYANKSMSDLNLICVDLNSDSEIPLGLQRIIVKGETNRFRIKSNHIYTTYDKPLEFKIHIIKNDEIYDTQEKMIFSKREIRQITSWLTSTTLPLILNTVEDGESINYCGIFTNIETFVVGNDVYGFILTFTNDSPFAYSDVVGHEFLLKGNSSKTIPNYSDMLDNYCNPIMKITPHINSDFYMCNLSDCKILEEGKINVVTGDKDRTLANLLEKINAYAFNSLHDVSYYYDGSIAKTWADKTAIRIALTEKDGTKHYGFSFYLPDGSYKIIEGAFMTLKLFKNLPVEINCDLLCMQDSIGRMIKFSDMGIEEEDYIYWLRLKNGDNTLVFYADNCDVSIEYREMLKVGAA